MSKQERFKPKRREVDPVRRNHKGDCVKCENFTRYNGDVCLWKLEAQIDKASQHMLQALSIIRKVTATQRQLIRHSLTETEEVSG